MDPRRPPEYTVEVTVDRASAKEVVKGLLHTLFFHRLFTPLYPATHDVLDTTLPYISDSSVEGLIDVRTTALLRHLDSRQRQQQQQPSSAGVVRCNVQVQFLERKRRKSGWFASKQDEETVWEVWTLEVGLLTSTLGGHEEEAEARRQRREVERGLRRAATKIVGLCARDKGHIPPITTNETNPFPYQIHVNPKGN